MKKNSILIVSLTIVVLILALIFLKTEFRKVTDFESCVAAGNPVMESYPRQCRDEKTGGLYVEELVGGQRDEHGCLGPAGYSWNETLKVCLKEWEIQGLDREVLEAMTYAPKENGTTVVGITKGDCDGCFIVEYDILGRRKTVDVSGELKHFCSPESRGPYLYCIQVYEPVCGSDNKTHSNSCTACLNSSVEYYIAGECQ